MAITYKVTKIRNPRNPDVDFFHGQAVKTGELNFEKLAKRINNSTTVTQSDCYAVLKSMKDHIIEALTEGQVVVTRRVSSAFSSACIPTTRKCTNPTTNRLLLK